SLGPAHFFGRGAARLCSISTFGSGPRDRHRRDRESGLRPGHIWHTLAQAFCRSGDGSRRFPHCARLCPLSGRFLAPHLRHTWLPMADKTASHETNLPTPLNPLEGFAGGGTAVRHVDSIHNLAAKPNFLATENKTT